LVKRPRNKQKGSLEESCESLIIVGTADGREERRRKKKKVTELQVNKDALFCIYMYLLA